MPIAFNILDWATEAEVRDSMLVILKERGADQRSEDVERLLAAVTFGMATATDDIMGYLAGGKRGLNLAKLNGWHARKSVYIQQSIFRTFEQISTLSTLVQDAKPQTFNHIEKFKDELWWPTDSGGNQIKPDSLAEEDEDGVDGIDHRGNSRINGGRMNQSEWQTRLDTTY